LEARKGRLYFGNVDVGAALAMPDEPLHPTVAGKRLLFVVSEPPEMTPVNEGPLFRPRTLNAVELSSGKLVWQRQLAGRYVPSPAAGWSSRRRSTAPTRR